MARTPAPRNQAAVARVGRAVRSASVVAVALLATVPLGGCGGSAAPSEAARVSGRLEMTGGPAGASPQGVPGRVTFEADDGGRVTASADSRGAFGIAVRPGRYTVTGTSPQFSGSCAADGPVTVPAGGLAGLTVACSRK
jgi:hypothetical protein